MMRAMELRRLPPRRRTAVSLGLTVLILIGVSGLVAVLEGPVGVPECLVGVPPGRRSPARSRSGPAAGVIAAFGRRLPALRLPVHPAALHADRRRPGRVAQPVLLLVGRDRRRPARGRTTRPGRGRRSRASARLGRFSGSAARWRRADRTTDALPEIVAILRAETDLARVWVGLAATERAGAQSSPTPADRRHRRRPASSGRPPQDARRHARPVGPRPPAAAPRARRRARIAPSSATASTIEAGGRTLGSICGRCASGRNAGQPDRAGDPAAGRLRPTRSARRSSRTASRRRGRRGRDRPPERRAQDGAARVGVPRPADAAGHDPGGRRQPLDRDVRL